MNEVWYLKHPMNLPVRIFYDGDLIRAEFPAIPGCNAKGQSIDEAVLNLAKAILFCLEVASHEHGA
jgi:predicted RNase H-like HicB family nuclease